MLPARRGIESTREAVHCWISKFGPLFAANAGGRRQQADDIWTRWVRIRGGRTYLWRAIDDEGEVLDVLVQKWCNRHAALKLLRRLLKDQRTVPRRSPRTSWHWPKAAHKPDPAPSEGVNFVGNRAFLSRGHPRMSVPDGPRCASQIDHAYAKLKNYRLEPRMNSSYLSHCGWLN